MSNVVLLVTQKYKYLIALTSPWHKNVFILRYKRFNISIV